jgi:hypothetical protein
VISLITLIYVSLFIVGFKYRNTIAFKARSPKLLALGIFFLYLDSMGNTLIFSRDNSAMKWKPTCAIGIFVIWNNDGLLFADVQNIASLLVLQTVLDKLDLES